MRAIGVMAVSCVIGIGSYTAGFVSADVAAEPPRSPTTDSVARLASRVDRMISENAKLCEEVQRLAARPRPISVRRADDEVSSAAAVREEERPATSSRDPLEGIEDRIIAALAKAEERAAQERAERAVRREQGRLDDQVAKLAEQLGLAPYQASLMRDSMAKAQAALGEKRAEVFASGGGRQEMRAAASDVQAMMKDEFAAFMTPDQLEKYDEVQPGFGGRGGFGGGRGGG